MSLEVIFSKKQADSGKLPKKGVRFNQNKTQCNFYFSMLK